MNDSTFSLAFPAVAGRKVTGAFDGGDISSDAGLLLVGLADRELGLTEVISGSIKDTRDQKRVRQSTCGTCTICELAYGGGFTAERLSCKQAESASLALRNDDTFGAYE